MRLWRTMLSLSMSLLLVSCGGKSGSVPPPNSLSGNWQISLIREANPTPLNYSGFLVQSGSTLAGSVILGSGCSGVGPVSGSLNGQNLALTISEFGQDVSLVGTLPPGGFSGPPGSTLIGGAFSTPAGGCTAFPNAGTWSAIRVAPIAGTFHGIFTSISEHGVFDVSGNLSQGPNTGNSNATLSGNVNLTSTPHFCSYLNTANLTGVISGTTVVLDLYNGTTGLQITQISASLTPDGSVLSGSYSFPATSNDCSLDQGTFQLMFP